jgi:hypothetical protein
VRVRAKMYVTGITTFNGGQKTLCSTGAAHVGASPQSPIEQTTGIIQWAQI